jgi:hypothetical protein
MASTFAASAADSMTGVLRYGYIGGESVSLDTMSSAPTSATKATIGFVLAAGAVMNSPGQVRSGPRRWS